MPASFVTLRYHIVFSTKHREQLIVPEIRPQLYAYLGGILREYDGCLLEVDGTDDHIHLLASISKTMSVADTLRLLKTNSSKWIHETFTHHNGFAWQDGYAAFTVSQSNVEQVREYIRRQEEHHRYLSFQDELRALLHKHGINFDERYLWD